MKSEILNIILGFDCSVDGILNAMAFYSTTDSGVSIHVGTKTNKTNGAINNSFNY